MKRIVPSRRRLRAWKTAALAAAGAVLVVTGMFVAYGLLIGHHEREVVRRVGRYEQLIARSAERFGLPAGLIRDVIRVESGGDPDAVSPRGARGLMQITPVAEREVLSRLALARGDLHDPGYNITLGTAYLRQLIERFDGDLWLALAAYHAGPTRIARLRRKYPTVPSRELIDARAPRSTRAYCRKLLADRPGRLILVPTSEPAE